MTELLAHCEGVILQRLKYIESIGKWYDSVGPKPLILRGARQVGKSTLVRCFAEQRGINLVEVNLEKHLELNTTFATLDTKRILAALESTAGKRIARDGRQSLLFLDEIQATPQAIGALRYFFENESGLRVIAAGSLLEFTLSKGIVSIPVGRVDFLNIHPMSFHEFLQGVGEQVLIDKLKECVLHIEIDPAAHSRLIELQRVYLYVGGMPEAVRIYCDSQSNQAVREVQDSILETFKADFAKYIGNRDVLRFRKSFEFGAFHACEKVKYTAIDSSDSARGSKSDLLLLQQARIHSHVYHSDANGLPLKAEKDDRIFKLLFLDVGLMNALSEASWKAVTEKTETQLVNEGPLAEQFVGQELLTKTNPRVSPELFYWIREGKSENAEIDFVWPTDRGLLPIEVKSGKSGTLKSLHQFCALRSIPRALRFDLGLPARQTINTRINVSSQGFKAVSYELLSLPLYCAGEINSIASEA